MRECPKCMSWWDGDTCPVCEVKLMSEYSNNDGSDGFFTEPVPEPHVVGSAKWAIEEMKQGNAICHPSIHGGESKYMIVNGRIRYYVRGSWRDLCDITSAYFPPLGIATGWEIYVEPQPKFANIKVGDWVELAIGKHFQVKRIVEQSLDCDDRYFMLDGYGCDTNARYDFNGNNLYKEFHGSNDIVKILSPKEVIMDFSSGIVGTISKNSEFDWIFIHNTSGKHIASIRIKSLDHATRTKVESLLKAQEEECHN